MHTNVAPVMLRALQSYGLGAQNIHALDCRTQGSGGNQRQNIANKLDDVWKKMGEPKLLLIMTCDKDARVYGDIKWWGDCLRGIPTICVTYEVMDKIGTHRDKSVIGDLA